MRTMRQMPAALPALLTAREVSDALRCDESTVYREHVFAERFRAALATAGIDDYVRPFHDLRHTALTNEAAAGSGPIALMTKAGHTDMKTTRRYLHLAGIVFRDEAERLEQRLLGGGNDKGSPSDDPSPVSLPSGG